MTGVEAIADLFAGPGARDYLGEAVTIGVHMRQAGALAEAAAPLIAAALLHDVGHLRNATDSKHGDAGARWLGQWFGEALRAGRGRRTPLGRRRQGPLGHPAFLRALRAAAQ
jgi:predicted HD phosphohydrolase